MATIPMDDTMDDARDQAGASAAPPSAPHLADDEEVAPRILPGRPFRNLMPKSLLGRSLLIVILPIALMQLAVMWAFFDAHWQRTTKKLSENMAGDVAFIVSLYEQDPSQERFRELADLLRETTRMTVVLQEGEEIPAVRRDSYTIVLDRTLRSELERRLDRPVWLNTRSYTAYVDIRVEVEGGVLRFLALRERVQALHTTFFLLWLVVATAILTAVAILFIRNQVRTIARLAAAADAFGAGREPVGFKPAGAAEVRRAGHAFIKMRARIERYLAQRTAMLAGVSHDLRTPLTRLKLHFALHPDDPDAAEALEDIRDMERMLEDYLEFARGEAKGETVASDLGLMAAEAAGKAARGGAAAVYKGAAQPDERLVAAVRAGAISRAMANLLSNAAMHAGRIEVSVERAGDWIVIHIDDDGPGIPEDKREEAFRAFTRLGEGSKGDGVGLGLAITREIARAHGGDVLLSTSPLGGLRASLRLPAGAALD